MFLCLLPFTLSNAQFQFQIDNNLVPIIYLWRIPVSPLPPIRELLNISIPSLNRIQFKSNETYILLSVTKVYTLKCQAFYWIGKNTFLEQRQNTAGLISVLMYEHNLQFTDCKLLHLSREEDGRESKLFRVLFNLPNKTPVPKLYNISGDNGQNIIEVPLRYSELNGTDSFLLDNGKYVNIWNAKPIQYKCKQEKARALAHYIFQIERFSCSKSSSSRNIQIGDESEESFSTFKNVFLNYLDEATPLSNFPKDDFTIFNGDFQNKRNGQLRLFEYSWKNNEAIYEEIFIRPLELTHFKRHKVHIMIDHYNGNLFIYISDIAPHQLNKETMAAAELIYMNMYVMTPSGRHRKLTLLRKGYRLPVHFIVNFPGEVEHLGYYREHH